MAESLAHNLSRTARQFGSRPALIEPGRRLSYTDLDLRSDDIANAIRRVGGGPGRRIGIFRRKNIETIVAIYGILKAGGAYVPIDPKIGDERLAAILSDAAVELVFTEPLLAPRLEPLVQAGLINWVAGGDGELLKFRQAKRGRRSMNGPPVSQSDPPAAYILYTSGSTGPPKGVEHTDASALAFASWAADYFAVSSDDRLSCHAPLHFDLTTFDLFAASLKGACVVLVPEDLTIFPQRVASLIEDERITIWYSVPFALMQLADRGNLGAKRLSDLREIIFAGERYPAAALRRLAQLVPHSRLTNLFGPTETNVCTYHRVTAEDLARDEYCPIGRACPYASLLIIDQAGQEARPGETGELLVGGSSVMRGYLNRPDLNARVFVESTNGMRFFRTGDLVSRLPSGGLQFHGRLDRQVKIRGFRIELEEIETALLNRPGVAVAAAWIKPEENGFHQILAAVETHPAADLAENVLTLQLADSLTPAAVPRRIFILDRLPRTLNGKVDYAALAALA